jgi:nickel transport protein
MVFLNVSPALAHRVSIFAWVQGNTVHTQSKFMGGKRPEQALVEVFDDTGNLLLKGKTDTQGLFSFQAPKISDMQIVLTAGMGHRAVWSLSKEDFQGTDTDFGNHGPLNDAPLEKSQDVDPKTPKIHPSPENGLSAAEIEALLESTLDRKLKPVMDRITALNEKRISLSDILGGIGYIAGLAGLAAYMQYRRKRSGLGK